MFCLISKIRLERMSSLRLRHSLIMSDDSIVMEVCEPAVALPQESVYDDYEYTEEDVDYSGSLPEFTAEPQHQKVKEGGTVTLSCEHNERREGDQATTPDFEPVSAPYALIIKKEATSTQREKLLFVDNVKVNRDKRYKISHNKLEISGIKKADAGAYICQLESTPPVILTHQIEVEYAPKIKAVTEGEQRVHKGDSVRLECEAQGNPMPTIRWSKQDGRLPSGVMEEEVSSSSSTVPPGYSITLAEVDRHVEGTYVCTADNGIGEPASDYMSVVVEYPPEIITEKDMVRTEDGDTVELVCIVHARPTPKVEWAKDGTPLAIDSHIEEQQNGGRRYSVKITQIEQQDFGEYTCSAENKFGIVESSISLSGHPEPPHFTSSPNGGEENSYTLTWETESYYPITEYRLKYRKAKANDSTDEPGEWIDMTHEVNGNMETNGLKHTLKHTLGELEAATDYNAMVQIKNQYMWGDSAEFSFSTRKVLPTTISTTTTTTPIPTTAILTPTSTNTPPTTTSQLPASTFVGESERSSSPSVQEVAQPTKISGASAASIASLLVLVPVLMVTLCHW
ncbi:neural cell adhesion molecule 1-like isoform X2 [Palaemon carinicauda]|uniref:neural cell adhesion molecule 1-like isoform X2 n=1 Tax=Palaemon carinicauda TaxID=392227 RepID=UPI0035B60E14